MSEQLSDGFTVEFFYASGEHYVFRSSSRPAVVPIWRAAISPSPSAPAGMGKRGTCPPLEMLQVFCALQNAQWTNYLCIIFTTCRPLLEASPPDSHRGSIPGLPLVTFAPRPLSCPSLEKILRAPMDISVYSVE